MAIAGFSVKTGAKGSATAHAAYVARTGAYERYTEQGEVLEAREHGNMPGWAEHDPSRFWTAADAHERANGSSYREFLISLPRELSADERRNLVKEFVAQELGETHAYQYAIHVPRASDGLDNPHVHLMFSERRTDEINRDPDQYFKRFNVKHPERGGCQKGFGEQPGMKLTAVERKAELKALRERWGVCVNAALERCGHSVRVNMKSYADRGLDIVPEPKQLPSAWRAEGKASVLSFREARAAELEVRRDPSVIIERVSSMKALFTRQDLYRSLNTVTDDPEVFNQIKAQLDGHPELVPLETGGGARIVSGIVDDSRGTGDGAVDYGFGACAE
ncbi:MobA/MobL family protein [Granulosicoccus sp.]|nr:MobA/MobL family protein [Granulosicoccus sp.]MDB4224307.1 MobA/MobL family protein [Granulosicoccus sp.]